MQIEGGDERFVAKYPKGLVVPRRFGLLSLFVHPMRSPLIKHLLIDTQIP